MSAIAAQLRIGRYAVERVIATSGLTRRRGYRPLQASIRIPSDDETVRRAAKLWDQGGNLVWLRKTTNASSARFTISAAPDVLDWLKATFQCGNVYSRGRSGPPRRRGQWEINRTKDTVALLEAMLPFIQRKRRLVDQALAKMRPFV